MKIKNYDLTRMVIPEHLYAPGHIKTLRHLLTQTVHWRNIAIILEANSHLSGLPSVAEFEVTTQRFREQYDATIRFISEYRDVEESEIDEFYCQADSIFTHIRDESLRMKTKLYGTSLYEKFYVEDGFVYDYILGLAESVQKTYWKSINGAKALAQRLMSRLNRATKRDTRKANRMYRNGILSILEWD